MRRWNSYVASLCSGISLFGAQPAEKVMDELNRSITVHKDERGENIVHSTSFCGLDQINPS
uniref:Putative ovule protein n=1 Tax=Solanum chacoense TaxID=4108 RepID=A0A0V0HWJ3_SOLCH